jgi:hypothetical protein
MSLVGFEPTISTDKQLQTYALNRMDIETGTCFYGGGVVVKALRY